MIKRVFLILFFLVTTLHTFPLFSDESNIPDYYSEELRDPNATSKSTERSRLLNRWVLGLPALPLDLLKAGLDPTLNYIEDKRIVKKVDWAWKEIKKYGFYPEARFAPGTFFGGAGLQIKGEQLFKTDRTIPNLKYDVTGGFARKGHHGLYTDIGGGYLIHAKNNPDFFHASRFLYDRKPLEDFFGIGHNTSLGDEAIYAQEEMRLETKGGVPLPGQIKSETYLRYRHVNIGNGHKEGEFRIKEHFTETEVPGIHGADLINLGFSLGRDTRDRAEDPLKGGYQKFDIYWGDDIHGQNFHYLNMKLDAAHFFQLWSDRRVLALRLFAGRTQPLSNGDIPFFELQRVGGYGSQPIGSATHRGYEYNRFFDKTALVFTPEYRYNIWKYGDFAADSVFFVDLGGVAKEIHSFGLDKWRASYGGGIRVKHLRDVFFSLEIAHSNDGTKVYIRTKAPF